MLQLIFNHLCRVRASRWSGTETGPERHQSHRLYTSLTVECRAIFRDRTGKFATQAVINNISHDGAYLDCVALPNLIKGEVGYFTFRALSSPKPALGTIHLAAKVRVRRIERHNGARFSFGLAVEFLSGPLIFYQK